MRFIIVTCSGCRDVSNCYGLLLCRARAIHVISMRSFSARECQLGARMHSSTPPAGEIQSQQTHPPTICTRRAAHFLMSISLRLRRVVVKQISVARRCACCFVVSRGSSQAKGGDSDNRVRIVLCLKAKTPPRHPRRTCCKGLLFKVRVLRFPHFSWYHFGRGVLPSPFRRFRFST